MSQRKNRTDTEEGEKVNDKKEIEVPIDVKQLTIHSIKRQDMMFLLREPLKFAVKLTAEGLEALCVIEEKVLALSGSGPGIPEIVAGIEKGFTELCMTYLFLEGEQLDEKTRRIRDAIRRTVRAVIFDPESRLRAVIMGGPEEPIVKPVKRPLIQPV